MSKQSATRLGAALFHDFTRDLWFEFKVAADYTTGMSEPTRGTLRPPGGFVQNELGFGADSPDKCGPGCRCTAARSVQAKGGPSRRSRSHRDWNTLVAHATAAAKAA